MQNGRFISFKMKIENQTIKTPGAGGKISLLANPRNYFLSVILLALLAGHAFSFARNSDEPKWLRVSSPHFAVLTDADDKKASGLLLRLEQMRTVIGHLLLRSKLNMPEPLD